jgi:predicted DNA-binding mobile mystery protein A
MHKTAGFVHSWMLRLAPKDAAMTPDQTLLARRALDRRRLGLELSAFATPPGGWLKAMREALGLTVRQLAARLDAAPSRIPAIEKAELSGATTLRTLRETAEAMDCVFVYAIVPRTTLEATRRAQAERRADKALARMHHTMALENQALNPADLAYARERLIADLLAGPPRRLWDEPDGRP